MKFDDPEQERKHYAELKKRVQQARQVETVEAMKRRMEIK